MTPIDSIGIDEPRRPSSAAEPCRTRRVGRRRLVGLLAAVSISMSLHTPSTNAAEVAQGTTIEGVISYYGKKFAGRKTASGERFDPSAMTMAHPSWPFGTQVRITNLANARSVMVRVNDRGPTAKDRIADVSSAAARQLDMVRAGLTNARLEVVATAATKSRP